jgi:hypothetical protein
MSDALRPWSVALGCFFLILPALPCSALDLELSTVKMPGGEFRFHTNFSEPINALPIEINGENVQVAKTPHYTLYADLDDIRFTKYGFFRYKLYAQPRPGVEEPLTSFVVHGEPVGSFLAQMVGVDFALGVDPVDQKQITLPIFSLESPGYLETPDLTEPEEIELPGEKEIRLRIKNRLEKLPVSVTGIRQPSPASVWKKVRILVKDSEDFREFEVAAAAEVDDVLILKAVPDSTMALTRALFPRSGKSEHERVTAYLEYRTPWGIPKSLEIKVPVRFVPWPPMLFLAVGIGALLGSFVPVLTNQSRRSRWLRAFAASLLTAVLAELIAILLVQHDSEFRLLGFVLDPFQLLPATLIGFFMGLLGFKSLEALKRVIPGFSDK